MDRRAFLARLSANAILIGLGVGCLTACGSEATDGTTAGSSGGPTDGTCTSGAGVVEVGFIHTHSYISLSSDEVADPTPRAILLLSGDHFHTYNFTTQDFVDLQNGLTVTKVKADMASGSGHDHVLEIIC